MMAPRLNRRDLLTGAASLAAPALIPTIASSAAVNLRVGAILPIAGDAMPVAAENIAQLAEQARTGLILSEEDLQRNAGLLGGSVSLLKANAPSPASAARAAQRLIELDRVSVLIGGFTTDDATAIADVADETGTLFLNIGAASDTLRKDCRPTTFHVESSAAMYLDAAGGWFIRAGHRRWHLVYKSGDEGEALRQRAVAALTERHWGASIAGETRIKPHQRNFGWAVEDVAVSKPDVVLLLTDWLSQLDFLARFEASELTVPVTGFPHAAAQTRYFYGLARHTAPVAGAGYRPALWEATLDAYGARELNARFGARWGRPMDPCGWAGYQALRIAYEAAVQAGGTEGHAMASHLASEAVFDVHKGIGVSFRPWDHQLRQSLYLARVSPEEIAGRDLAALTARASLVGELPAIYMPGTDPVERLDQLGDIRAGETCGARRH